MLTTVGEVNERNDSTLSFVVPLPLPVRMLDNFVNPYLLLLVRA
jgi:hypothetical protein